MPSKLYFEKAINPTIYEALKALSIERPANPIEFFAYYLITHNPYNKEKSGEENSVKK